VKEQSEDVRHFCVLYVEGQGTRRKDGQQGREKVAAKMKKTRAVPEICVFKLDGCETDRRWNDERTRLDH